MLRGTPQPAAISLQSKGFSCAKHERRSPPRPSPHTWSPCVPGPAPGAPFWPAQRWPACLPAGGLLTRAKTGSAGNRRASPQLRKGSCLFLGRHGVLVETARDPEPPRLGLPPSSSAPLLAPPSNPFCPLWRGGPQHPFWRSTVLLCPQVPAEPWEQPLPHPHVYCLCGRYMVELSLWVCLLVRPAGKAASLS